jgi:hypothetical protein
MAASVPTKTTFLGLFFRSTLCGLNSFSTLFCALYSYPVTLPNGKVPVRDMILIKQTVQSGANHRTPLFCVHSLIRTYVKYHHLLMNKAYK